LRKTSTRLGILVAAKEPPGWQLKKIVAGPWPVALVVDSDPPNHE